MFSRAHPIAAALLVTAVLAAGAPAALAQAQEEEPDHVQALVSRLTLDDYKSTLKGLTQFGDRRQGTQRNRDAVDWIEEWLQSVGCTNTERIHYEYPPPLTAEQIARREARAAAIAAARAERARAREQGDEEARGGGARGGPPEPPDLTTPTGGLVGRRGGGSGGSTIFGHRGPTGVNRDLDAQPDERIRELNREEPVDGPRSEVYCTKVGTTRPDEMYIIGAHMDGHGVNEAVNDDG